MSAPPVTALRVSEVFGPTVQGEGPSTGRLAHFIRLGGCNLDCRWCDTPYTWDWTGKNGVAYSPRHELRWASLAELCDAVAGARLVVITGGEPLLQQERIAALLEELDGFTEVEIETNGTIAPAIDSTPVLRFNVSPKLANSGVKLSKRRVPAALEAFAELAWRGRAAFKFVACDPGDLDEVEHLARMAGIPPHAIWVMPEGTTRAAVEARQAELAQAVIDRGWNISGRLHVQLWGNRRGV